MSNIEINVGGQGQSQLCIAVDIMDLACRVQQKAITLRFKAKNDLSPVQRIYLCVFNHVACADNFADVVN